ncbi:MAG: UDP-N-acetylmuramoyl-tripeptide--D-alanyl-D-alanine ligase [Clostridia bacterium]|nr:UDP-N-acetylmuramoyl-tripeptide--D-alanyl-D-alanine ligase [Clostridia bacterium]
MINGLKYSFEGFASAINGKLFGDNGIITAISVNSKETSKSGHCFIAINGKKYKGISFVNEAINNGAKLIVSDQKIECDAPIIYVEDTTRALGLLANAHKGKTKVVGVTGSAGKTTVKDMIAAVLKQKYSVYSTKENQNNEIGVPLTLLEKNNAEICVVEMGMRGLNEIAYLSKITEPDIGVITNCGSAHLGLLGSYENIFKAKTEMLDFVKETAVLPSEERFRKASFEKGIKGVFVGDRGDYFPTEIKQESGTISFNIGKCTNVMINSIFHHDVLNAVYAFAVGKIFGLEDEKIKKGLKEYKKSQLRGEITVINGCEIICDCYNASYESMEGAILNAIGYAYTRGKRLILLLGDMLELGDDGVRLHRKIGELCKDKAISDLYVRGELAKEYIKGYGKGIYFSSNIEAGEEIYKVINKETVLLVKASNALNFKEIIEKMRELENEEF